MTLRIAPVLVVCVGSLLANGCGRSAPDVFAADDVRALCFDEEAELTAVLDDDYLPIETELIDEDAVRAIAFDEEAELTALLDDDYLSIDTVVLDEEDVAAICFDEASLTDVLDDVYLRIGGTAGPVDFNDLVNVPADLLDGDDGKVYTGVAPVVVDNVNDTVSLDETGCVDGEVLTFVGNAFTCAAPAPVTNAGVENVTSAAANGAVNEALPFVVKIEVSTGAIAGLGTNVDTPIYSAADRSAVNFLIIDAWVVARATTQAPTLQLTTNGNAPLTTAVAVPATNGVARMAAFQNANDIAGRTITTAEDLNVRVTSTAAANDAATITVFVMGLPL